jgi:hypothetical protein
MGKFFIVSGKLFVVIQYYFSLLLLDFRGPSVKRSDHLEIASGQFYGGARLSEGGGLF